MQVIEILNKELTGKKLLIFEGYLKNRKHPLSITLKSPVNAYDKIVELKKEIKSIEIANKELKEDGNYTLQFNFNDYKPIGFYLNSEFSVENFQR